LLTQLEPQPSVNPPDFTVVQFQQYMESSS